MKSLQNHRLSMILPFLATLLLLLPLSIFANAANSDFIPQNLKVDDVPNDDGTGLMLSWTPLPKEARIIEYRIYRGVSPDSLFFTGKTSVNAKTGVSSKRMVFYDKGYTYFCGLSSVGHLKHEKNQPKGSPLYKGIPRDININGPLLKQYRILGVIPKKQMYYHADKVIKKVDGKDKVYAGLDLAQISLYKKLNPGQKYYYTVLAVNESRHFYPMAEIVSGTPINNAPENPTDFSAVLVKDTNKLNFEWELPIEYGDVRIFKTYLINKDQIDKWNEYVKIANTDEKAKNPAIKVFEKDTTFPVYTPENTAILSIRDGKLYQNNETEGVDFDVNNLGNYRLIFAYSDGRYESYSKPCAISTCYSTDLPALPKLKVIDRPNDQGDYMQLSWGRPIAYVSKVTLLNAKHSKIRVSYDFFTNKDFKIKNIYFKILDSHDNAIKTVNEYYQDNVFDVKLPKNVDPLLGLKFEMTFKTNNSLPKDYAFTQEVIYDNLTKSLKSTDVYFGKVDVNKLKFVIYKNPISAKLFRLSKRLPATQREFNDNISYERSVYVGVSDFDAKLNEYLVSDQIEVDRDKKNETDVNTSIFASEANRITNDFKTKAETYKAKMDTAKVAAAKASFKEAYDYYNNSYHAILGSKILAEANKIKDDKKRMKILGKHREKLKRSFQYYFMITDGKGHFTKSDIYTKNNQKFFFPIPNWFDTDKYPMLISTLIFAFLVFFMVRKAKRGDDLYIRPIAGISEIDNAIGRATEMGRPILFVPGLSSIGDVATLAGLSILSRVAKKAAEYDTKILVPVRDYIVLPIAQEIVKEAHYEAGRPDTYDKNSVFYITTDQFAFVAGVNGVMIREKTATNFYMGMFWAESLIMTETGSSTGAIQIAGTDAVTQIPFFITTCDYTLIGEELYAASAYLAREPLMIGTLKAQDYTKFLILTFIVVGTILSSAHLTFLINAFPEK